jgi:hypothetical protein
MAAGFACVDAVHLRGTRRFGALVLAATIAVAAPVAWLAWNAHAHGDMMHFVARVARYRAAIGAASVPLSDKLLGYPRALMSAARGVVVLGTSGVIAIIVTRDPALFRRWFRPIITTVVGLAFLICGDVRDGAPTHHAERALLAPLWVMAAIGIDATCVLVKRYVWSRPRREGLAVGVASAAAVVWVVHVVATWREHPARAPEEQRETQIARGRELRARNEAHIDVTPCAYEHFALLAAYGLPERARIAEVARTAVTPRCPHVEPNDIE